MPEGHASPPVVWIKLEYIPYHVPYIIPFREHKLQFKVRSPDLGPNPRPVHIPRFSGGRDVEIKFAFAFLASLAFIFVSECICWNLAGIKLIKYSRSMAVGFVWAVCAPPPAAASGLCVCVPAFLSLSLSLSLSLRVD